MDGNKSNLVLCGFTGEWIDKSFSIELCILIPNTVEEYQRFFVSKEEFIKTIDKSMPLHPNIFDD